MSAQSKASRHVNDGGFDPKSALDPKKALVPATVQVNERRVAQGFWPKIRRVAAKVPFASDAVSVWYCVRDAETPTAAKGLMLAGLAYFVMPADAIPDVIAGLGFTDDAAVFALMLGLVGKNVKPRHRELGRRLIERLKGET
jgi:uncharacterized membrane protein YkvA (DUF1232 family)